MKKNSINSIFYFIAGVLLLIGPYILFKVCEAGEKPMRCYWSTKAVGVLAVLLVISAIVHLIAHTAREVIIVNVFVVAIVIFIILIASVIIGGCKMKTMPCQSITFPAFYIIGFLTALAAVIETIWRIKKEKKENLG